MKKTRLYTVVGGTIGLSAIATWTFIAIQTQKSNIFDDGANNGNDKVDPKIVINTEMLNSTIILPSKKGLLNLNNC